MSKEIEKNKYGLFTAIGMIVGIVIGSGIFFKSDNILVATGGSVSLGVLVFCIAAFGIIFGSLTISNLASRDSRAGGIITYAETSYNKAVACAFGWFYNFLYYPTLVAVIAWVSGIYVCMLFGIEQALATQVLIGFALMIVLYFMNIISSRLGGYFQNASTIIKLIPLIVIAIAGVIYGNPSAISASDIVHMKSVGWISAIAPIAFSFDGWIVSTSIAHEIKDSKRNLPKALVIAPLAILAIYVLYFVGISMYVGADQVMKLGDEHVNLVATKLFGSYGGKLILTFVVISILGTLNGLIIGFIRIPYSLAIRGMLPASNAISKVNKNLDMPVISALLAFVISSIWLALHYITQKNNLLPNSDISEISITMNYMLYVLIYFKVFMMGIKGEIKGIWSGKINPIMATCGSLIILWGGIQNPLFFTYALICLVVLVSAVVFWKSKKID